MRQGTFSTLFNQLPNNRPNRILVLSNISVLLYLRGLYSSGGGDFIPPLNLSIDEFINCTACIACTSCQQGSLRGNQPLNLNSCLRPAVVVKPHSASGDNDAMAS